MYRVVVKFGQVTFYSEKMSSLDAAIKVVDSWSRTQVPHGPFVHAIEQKIGYFWEVI